MMRRLMNPWEAEIRRACRRQFLRGAAAAGGAMAFGGLAMLESGTEAGEREPAPDPEAADQSRLTPPQPGRLDSAHESIQTSHAGGLGVRGGILRLVR
jgi:FtsP/CotA-like multicopper oxidase with cupredoxin domain